jgi:hypothetical protein
MEHSKRKRVKLVGFEQCSFSSSIITESLDGKIAAHKAG